MFEDAWLIWQTSTFPCHLDVLSEKYPSKAFIRQKRCSLKSYFPPFIPLSPHRPAVGGSSAFIGLYRGPQPLTTMQNAPFSFTPSAPFKLTRPASVI
jgi:hypothetical protein